MQFFWLGVLLTSGLFLIWLSFGVKSSVKFNHYDQTIHAKLIHNEQETPWQIIAFINDPKLMVVWGVLLAALLINMQQIKWALWVLATLGGTDLLGILLKKMIKRQRPGTHLAQENGYSFPSGHVLGASSMLLILLQLFSAQFGWVFVVLLLVLWLLIVFSRLRLQAHYPSDILGAASLAICCFSLAEELLTFI